MLSLPSAHHSEERRATGNRSLTKQEIHRRALAVFDQQFMTYGDAASLATRLMPGFHHSFAVLTLLFRRCRYTNSVRIP